MIGYSKIELWGTFSVAFLSLIVFHSFNTENFVIFMGT
jgi:hypothetical protein